MNLTRIWIAAVAFALALPWSVSPAVAQSIVDLESAPDSSVSVVLSFTLLTDSFGDLAGSDTDSAMVEGAGQLTVLPAGPPFAHGRMHELQLLAGSLEFNYQFLFGLVVIDVTLSDLEMNLLMPVDGVIDGAGGATFVDALLSVNGTAHMSAPMLGVDETYLVSTDEEATLTTTVSEDGGMLVVSGVALPQFTAVLPADQLPDGVSGAVVTVLVNAGDLVLEGPLSAGVPGDGDGDGDFDLADFASAPDCFTGPGGSAAGMCGLFDSDDDGDFDLVDIAALQRTIWAD